MSQDPAFLFYPGDYLRDTQTLSEKSQVAYDRIMCEHMRNICISKQQLKFFTKKLSDEEKEELMFTLTEIRGGFQIHWVAESIEKRRKYSESRRKNRKGSKKNNLQKEKKTSLTYDEHMENEIEIEIVNKDKGDSKGELSYTNELGLLFNLPPESPEFHQPYRQLFEFVRECRDKGQLEFLKTQTEYYFKLKELNGLSVCYWKTWINGKWNEADYKALYNQELSKSDKLKSSKFPGYYDQQFERKLTPQETADYHAHLKSLGWTKGQGMGGTHWNKPVLKQA